MMTDKENAIRIAEMMAKEQGTIYHVISICAGFDIMTDEHFQESGKRSHYKAVPND